MVFYSTVPPLPRPVRKVGAPLAAIIAMGTITGLILLLVTAADPAGAVLAIFLTTISMGLVLLCYLWLDRWEPEPPRLLVMAFLWGASVAVLFSLLFENVLAAALVGPEDKPGLVTGAVIAPAVEEAFKGMFLLVMMTGRRRNEMNTLTDCLVYAGFTAVGFAWVENIFYIASADTAAGSLGIAAMRLLISPFAHPLFTTMTAIGVYYALHQRGAAAKIGSVLLGYLAAVIIHGLWNGSALVSLRAYVGVYVMWMFPVFVAAIVLAVSSRRREQAIIAGKLPGLIASGLMTPAEAGWLGSLQSRKEAVAMAGRYGGRPAASAVKGYLSQAVELAYVRDRIDRGFGDERVFALQNEEAYGVAAARAQAGPVLAQMSAYPLAVR